MVDLIRPEIVKAARGVLQNLGFEVAVLPPGLCCGQIAWNSGDLRSARRMAKALWGQFQGLPTGIAIVSLSGSCTHAIHSMGDLFPEFHAYQRLRLWEFTDFLDQLWGVRAWHGHLDAKVAVHFSCHALRGLGLRAQVVRVLQRLEGVEVLPWPEAELCCGFGGTFSLKFPELSLAMARRKAEHLPPDTQILTSTDLACLANLTQSVQTLHPHVEVLHIAEVLARGHVQPSDS